LQKRIHLASFDQTSKFAKAIAPELGSGSTILLLGAVGAGKTHFARQVILSKLSEIDAVEDVPSPTFTLIQTYDLDELEIWHADLYRLSGENEVYELGLEAAFETDICLVEWPDRLGDLTPPDALSLTFELINEHERTLVLEWQSEHWGPIVDTAIEAVENASP